MESCIINVSQITVALFSQYPCLIVSQVSTLLLIGRTCGQRVFDPSPSDLLKDNRYEDKHLEETEVITRMNWVLYQYKLWDDLDAINWNVSVILTI